jgi:acyl-CoA reductase-like NAD-dependent aldehyde dehydrogenase
MGCTASIGWTNPFRRGPPIASVLRDTAAISTSADHPELDAAVAELRAHRARWVAVSPADRVRIVNEVRRDIAGVADQWSSAVAEAEGLSPDEAAEEVLAGPYLILRQLRLIGRSLRDIAKRGVPRIPGPVTTLLDGRVSVRVVPFDRFDRVMYPRVTADVWMQPGVTQADLALTQAVAYREPDAGAVCLVLGAGNVSSIAPLDAIYKLFVANRVVILKMHPTQAFLTPVLAAGLRSLVREGYLRIVEGGAAEGAYLACHPDVDELHITGSYRTYETVVFGAGVEGDERRLRDEPILHKPFTAELGNLTPVIIVPGSWTDAEIGYQADNIATMLTNNAGFNCTTPRVIITPAGWRLRQPFLNAIRDRLVATPVRIAYYPGAERRFDQFLGAHPEAELYGGRAGDRLPWALITDLDPGAGDDPCFTTEAFCGVFGELPLPSAEVADYLARAVAFANDSLWGSLNATLIVHPSSMRNPEVATAVEKAVADLRYGTVSINHWSALGFALGVTPWGAFPGHARNDIGSGTDVVHNTLMFSRVEKTVVRAPFRTWPKPIWFGSHRTARRLAPMLVRFEANPNLLRLAAMMPLAAWG